MPQNNTEKIYNGYAQLHRVDCEVRFGNCNCAVKTMVDEIAKEARSQTIDECVEVACEEMMWTSNNGLSEEQIKENNMLMNMKDKLLSLKQKSEEEEVDRCADCIAGKHCGGDIVGCDCACHP